MTTHTISAEGFHHADGCLTVELCFGTADDGSAVRVELSAEDALGLAEMVRETAMETMAAAEGGGRA